MEQKEYSLLESKICNQENDAFEALLEGYRNKYPKDLDVLLLQAEYEITNKRYSEALVSASVALKQNRLNLLANYYMAMAYEYTENWIESIRYFCRLFFLQTVQKDLDKNVIDEKILLQKITLINSKISEKEFENHADKYMIYTYEMMLDGKVSVDITRNLYVCNEQMPNFYGIHEINDEIYYYARYAEWLHSSKGVVGANNCVESKVEIQRADIIEQRYVYHGTDECLLPCVMNPIWGDISDIQICGEEGKCRFTLERQQSFSYYHVKSGTEFIVNHPFMVGKPIPLYHHNTNKKLVLTIFLDSFNAKILEQYPLSEVMPNTYQFFSKGIICTNAYAGSEFTYPSVTSYWTGMRPNHHKNLNDQAEFPIEDEFRLLSEYFHDAGYYTAKIGGNYSVNPDYGYLRGIDRFVYQQWIQGFNVNQVVDEVIEHMETFKETDQFIWCDIADLHDVAGYWPRSISVESKVSYLTNEVDNVGGSSLHQTFSPHRQEVYVQEMRHIDLYLTALYQYIERNYKQEDVVVAFLSDHGNGFNVHTGEPFLSEERMKVPLMFYGDFDKNGVCHEIIESVDYLDILCKLCGIEKIPSVTDGHLPVFFGGQEEKEFALAQSIYQNAPYYAGIFSRDHNFYLQTVYPTTWDCRIDFSEVVCRLTDKNGMDLKDEKGKLTEKYCKIIKKEIEEFDLNYGKHNE